MKKNGIYLDYASTTPTDEKILSLMGKVGRIAYGNASSLHYPGRLAKKYIDDARNRIAGVLRALPDEIIFTGSGTESDNLAVLGLARANKPRGKHIIISAIEHKAVIESVARLEEEGFEVSRAPVDSGGILDLVKFRKLLRKDTILVSVMYANNEIGTIQPIKEIADILRPLKKKTGYPFLHSDACQAAGALPLDVNELGVDLLTINGSKIYGPKGVGCLFVKKGIKLESQIVGGGQEKNIRAGTENAALISGLAEALVRADASKEKEKKRLLRLRDYGIKKIQASISGTRLNGHPTVRLPNNINFSFSGVEGESLALLLDYKGVYVSTGSACSSLDLSPSHVLSAIGLDAGLAHGSIRLTLGKDTTKAKLDMALGKLVSAVDSLRSLSSANINPNE